MGTRRTRTQTPATGRRASPGSESALLEYVSAILRIKSETCSRSSGLRVRTWGRTSMRVSTSHSSGALLEYLLSSQALWMTKSSAVGHPFVAARLNQLQEARASPPDHMRTSDPSVRVPSQSRGPGFVALVRTLRALSRGHVAACPLRLPGSRWFRGCRS